MDWMKWHLEKYKKSKSFELRLKTVQSHIVDCIRLLPVGLLSFVSVCSGDGRDILGLLESEDRMKDSFGVLIDSNAELVNSGRAKLAKSRVKTKLKFLLADATLASTYEGYVPADIVVIVGVFGNLRPTDSHQLIGNLPCLCKPGGYVVWNRHRKINDGLNQIAAIRDHFAEYQFEEIEIENTANDAFIVGTHQFVGSNRPLPKEGRLFEFTGYERIRQESRAKEKTQLKNES